MLSSIGSINNNVFTKINGTYVQYTTNGNPIVSRFTNPNNSVNYTVLTFQNPGSFNFKFTNVSSKVGYVVMGGGSGGSYGGISPGVYPDGSRNGGNSTGAGGNGGGIAYSPYSISNLTYVMNTNYTIQVGSAGVGGTSLSVAPTYGGDSYITTPSGNIYAYGGLTKNPSGTFASYPALFGSLNFGSGSYAYSYTCCDGGGQGSFGPGGYYNTGIGYRGVYNARGGNMGSGSISGYPPGNGFYAIDLTNLSVNNVFNKYELGGYLNYSNTLGSHVKTLSNPSIYPTLNYVCVSAGDLNANSGVKYQDILLDTNINISNYCAGGGGGGSTFSVNNYNTSGGLGVGGGGNGTNPTTSATLYGSGGGGGYSGQSGGNGYSGCVIIYFPTLILS